MMLIALLTNFSLLISLTVFSNIINQKWNKKWYIFILQGLIFGATIVLGMLNPLVMGPGLIFDGRSVMLSLCGLYFGPFAVLIAGSMALVCRIFQGGMGMAMGISVIVATSLTGVLFHYIWGKRRLNIKWYQLLLFGVLNHIVMLLLTALLPADARKNVLENIGVLIVTIYPAITILVGSILNSQKNWVYTINALQKSEEKYSDLLETANSIVIRIDTSSTILYMNEFALDFFGYSREEIIGKSSIGTIVPKTDQSGKDLENMMRDIEKNPEKYKKNENENICKDGRRVWILWSNKPIYDDNGKYTEMLSIGNDLTYKKKAESELITLTEEISNILDSISDAFFSLNNDMVITYFNNAAETAFHKSSMDVLNKKLFDVFPEIKGTEFEEKFCLALQEKIPLNFEIHFEIEPYRDWYDVRIYPQANGISVYLQVITERKDMVEVLRKSEEKYRFITENATDVIWVINIATGRFTYISPSVYQLRGFTAEEAMAQSIEEALSEESARRVMEDIPKRIQDFLANPSSCNQYLDELQQPCRDGRLIWIETSTRYQYNQNTEIEVIGVSRDITERKRMEEIVRESESKYRLIFENMTSGFAVHEMIYDDTGKPVDYRFIEVNPAFEKLTGIKASQVLGKRIKEVLPNTEDYWIETYGEVAKSGEALSYENFSVELGKYFDTWVFCPEKGKFAVVFNDITERKLAEEKVIEMNKTLEIRVNEALSDIRKKDFFILQQTRLASLGELLQNIAHHWRQPLASLGLIVQNIQIANLNNIVNPEYLNDKSVKAMETIDFMSKTIDDFINLYRSKEERETFAIESVMRDCISVIQLDTNNSIDIEFNEEMDINIEGIRNQFSQAIMNILMNAKDALQERGVSRPNILIDVRMEKEKPVIAISDNAGGIDERIKDKIFEPYFTTKEKATGMGLYMAKMIVEENMGGILTADNTEVGALFTITLPYAWAYFYSQDEPMIIEL